MWKDFWEHTPTAWEWPVSIPRGLTPEFDGQIVLLHFSDSNDGPRMAGPTRGSGEG